MKRDDLELNEVWQLYDQGRSYNNQLEPNQYALVNTNIEFFSGNQWVNMQETEAMRRLPRPTFNIIKRITSLFIASLTSTKTTINFDALPNHDTQTADGTDAAEYATAEARNLFEKFKLDYRIRDALYDGAITGDYCAHFFWNPEARPYGGAFGSTRGEINMELVDGINVMFGNPNCNDVEKQPYILVIGRDTVENLKREASLWRRRSGISEEQAASARLGSVEGIRPDSETDGMAGIGGKTEIRSSNIIGGGKALYCYMYRRDYEEVEVMNPVTGIRERRLESYISVSKATRNCYIFKDVRTGLSRYPIAWGNWERQKNQYHGRALVTGIVPNQISINLMMAMTILHTELSSFPIRLYNEELIDGLSNEIGQTIGVRGLQPGEPLSSVVATIAPAEMSAQILAAIDRVMDYTKECLGATDAQLGDVQPDNTSALMVLQTSAEVPLENIRAGLHDWVEDIGAILLDMMGTYYGKRPIVREREQEELVPGPDGNPQIDPVSGQIVTARVKKRVIETFDFRVFKNLWLNVNTDVGATTYYSELAEVQTLDNLRRDGILDAVDYLERLPDKLIPRKSELIEKLKSAATAEAAADALPKISKDFAPAMGGALDTAKKVASLPTSIQAKYNSLPRAAQRAVFR